MPFAERAEIGGLPQILQQLEGVKARVAKKALRKGVTACAKELKWAAKSRAPRRAYIQGNLSYKGGLLKKSLGEKIKVYGGTVVGIVGARKGFKQVIGTRVKDSGPRAKYPKKAGDPIYADPTKYLHLVERGTTRSAAAHFLKDALAAVKGSFQATMAKAVNDALNAGGSA